VSQSQPRRVHHLSVTGGWAQVRSVVPNGRPSMAGTSPAQISRSVAIDRTWLSTEFWGPSRAPPLSFSPPQSFAVNCLNHSAAQDLASARNRRSSSPSVSWELWVVMGVVADVVRKGTMTADDRCGRNCSS
jgi:hypothetical protein